MARLEEVEVPHRLSVTEGVDIPHAYPGGLSWRHGPLVLADDQGDRRRGQALTRFRPRLPCAIGHRSDLPICGGVRMGAPREPVKPDEPLEEECREVENL